MNRALAIATVAALLGACHTAGEAPLVAAEPSLSAPRPGAPARAGYLELTNPGSGPVTIDRVTSPQFGRVEIHRTLVADGVARMEPVATLTLAPGETAHFEPGGLHLMLLEPRAEATGDVTLEFWSAGTRLLAVAVADSAGA